MSARLRDQALDLATSWMSGWAVDSCRGLTAGRTSRTSVVVQDLSRQRRGRDRIRCDSSSSTHGAVQIEPRSLTGSAPLGECFAGQLRQRLVLPSRDLRSLVANIRRDPEGDLRRGLLLSRHEFAGRQDGPGRAARGRMCGPPNWPCGAMPSVGCGEWFDHCRRRPAKPVSGGNARLSRCRGITVIEGHVRRLDPGSRGHGRRERR